MALGSNHVTNTTAATFIPELWSDEIVAAYKKNLVLANLVNKMPMSGKKGDVLHIPKPTRGSANAKAAETQVTLQASTETEVTVTIDKHYEYSRLIEDITEAQALASLRRFYTDDAGYALAKQVDDDLFALGKSLGNGTGASWVHNNAFQINTSTGVIEAYDADGTADVGAFTDAAFRGLVQQLDDADVPMDNRALIVPPSARNTIMGIDRYMSSDFVNGRGVNNGQIGQLYGIDVYVTSNAPTIESGVKGAILFHKDAMVLAEQVGVRSQTQYKQEYLATLFTSDTLYGVEVIRPESGVVVALPA
jgi:HK97 family phage major capsid protein